MSNLGLKSSGDTRNGKANDIKYAQYSYTDYSNITRVKLFPLKLHETIFGKSGLSWCPAVLTFPSLGETALESHVGEVKLYVDHSSLKPLPWRPGVVNGFADFWRDGAPWSRCPRVFLRNQAQRAFDTAAGLQFAVGFELEFVLMDQDGVPLDTSNCYNDRALRGQNWNIFSDIVSAVEQLDIPVWQFHSESGKGQFEISIGPFTESVGVVAAADALILTRQAVYNVAALHNIKATFVPKPSQGSLGNGAHLHISVLDKQGKVVSEQLLRPFIAGVLYHLPALLPVLAPTTNSYARVQPQTFSGAYQMAGTENKEAPIRMMRNDDGALCRFELKSPDGTSNPYLMLGVVIAAGLNGIEEKLALPAEITKDIEDMPENQRPPRLPSSLQDALALFKGSNFLKQVFGEEMHSMFVKVREFEDEHYRGLKDPIKQVEYLLSRY